MNEIKLIALYYYICEWYDKELRWHCQRFSNYCGDEITDEEILTIFLFAVMEEEKFKVKSIHTYANRYLSSWFPALPKYSSFTTRLNRLAPVFPVLVQLLLNTADKSGIDFNTSVLDSMPIITCSAKRRGKVATELTNKGYCSTKKLHYYGVKLHGVGFYRKGQLPFPEIIKITPASEHDLVLRHDLMNIANRTFFADKAYSDSDLIEWLGKKNSIILTPVKKIKGQSEQQRQFDRAADDLFSTAVSRVRQPIESFFNWLIEKVDIQRASRVRSTKGLIVHVFGKIAASIASWIF